jgi:hypothetical protein
MGRALHSFGAARATVHGQTRAGVSDCVRIAALRHVADQNASQICRTATRHAVGDRGHGRIRTPVSYSRRD